MSGRELFEQLRRELASVEQAIRVHRYVTAPPPEESLRAFAGHQYTILSSDRRSFAHLRHVFPSRRRASSSSAWRKGRARRWHGCARSPSRSAPARPGWSRTNPGPDARRTRRSCRGLRWAVRAPSWRSRSWLTSPPGARIAGALPTCCGGAVTRRSSTSSPRPRPALRSWRWRSQTKGLPPATRHGVPAVRPVCCRPTSCCFWDTLADAL